jgi:hypothetical protein
MGLPVFLALLPGIDLALEKVVPQAGCGTVISVTRQGWLE